MQLGEDIATRPDDGADADLYARREPDITSAKPVVPNHWKS